jgi:hypothetical protein
MKINRKHKDRLFRFIFGDPEHKERTLELYRKTARKPLLLNSSESRG